MNKKRVSSTLVSLLTLIDRMHNAPYFRFLSKVSRVEPPGKSSAKKMWVVAHGGCSKNDLTSNFSGLINLCFYATVAVAWLHTHMKMDPVNPEKENTDPESDHGKNRGAGSRSSSTDSDNGTLAGNDSKSAKPKHRVSWRWQTLYRNLHYRSNTHTHTHTHTHTYSHTHAPHAHITHTPVHALSHTHSHAHTGTLLLA